MINITQELIKDIISYDPGTGVFTWIKRVNGRVPEGSVAGTYQKYKNCKTKYIAIHIKGKRILAHRLAFLYMTGKFPENEIDHINGNGCDNRWINLRDVTKSDNQRNAKVRSDNKTGVIGVFFDKRYGIWASYIKSGKNRVDLGRYNNLFDAACARKSAEIKYNFHVNHGSR